MDNRRFTRIGIVVFILTVGAIGLVTLTMGGAAVDGNSEDVTVSEVTLNETEADAGETIGVEAILENEGEEPSDIEITLEVDGGEEQTETAENVQPEFPIIAQFDLTLDDPGSYTISVNGVEAEEELVIEDEEDEESEEDEEDEENGEDEGDEENGEAEQDDFSVEEVTLEQSQIGSGESVNVAVDISNDGDEPGDFEAILEADGETVESETVPEVFPSPDVDAQHTFEFEPDEDGTYTISVNGVEAEEELTVGDDGGLFGFLGFLPLGLLRTIFLFIGLPILLIYLALKALAIYLGY